MPKNSVLTRQECLIQVQLEEIRREELRRGVLPEASVVVDWQPQAGPQSLALNSQADELLFGGSAGGGKTDLLLGMAGLNHQNSLILRRVFPSTRGIIERSREIYNAASTASPANPPASYNESLHLWRLANGKIIEFGALQYEKDKESYRGRPHDFYGWDEVTEFSESQFRFVNAWNRSTRPGQRCRVVATSNPPATEEGQWVIRYWGPWLDPEHPNPANPGELRYFITVDGKDQELTSGEPVEINGETVYPRSRTFIPAKLADNAYLRDSGYLKVLQGLPEPLRSQMLYGDFSISLNEDPWQIIPRGWVLAAQQRWKERPAPVLALSSIGVDVARGGKDKTVIAKRFGNWFAPLVTYPGKDTPSGQLVAGQVMMQRGGSHSCQLNIDVIGVGSSVYDTLKGMQVPFVNGVNVSERSEETDKSGKLKFINQRAELFWKFREALDPETGDDIALPPDSEILADLCVARWMLRTNGIQVESKADIKQRISRSPDAGDAILLAFWGSYGGGRPFLPIVGGQRPATTPQPARSSGGYGGSASNGYPSGGRPIISGPMRGR